MKEQPEKPHLFLWLAEVLKYWATGKDSPGTEAFLIESLFRDFLIRDKVIFAKPIEMSLPLLLKTSKDRYSATFVDPITTPVACAVYVEWDKKRGILVGIALPGSDEAEMEFFIMSYSERALGGKQMDVGVSTSKAALLALYEAIYAEAKDPSYISPSVELV